MFIQTVNDNQIEFLFAQPYLDEIKKRSVEWNRALRQLTAILSNVNLTDLFKDYDLNKVPDGVCFPVTLIVGEMNQYEFPFVKVMLQKFWGDKLEVKFHYELEHDHN